jgi:hypothetical protein
MSFGANASKFKSPLQQLPVLQDKRGTWRVYGGDPDAVIRRLC